MRPPDGYAGRLLPPGLILGLLAGHAAAAPPGPPAANTVNAGDLAQFCVGSDHVSQNVCRIYILGVTQGVVLGNARSAAPRLCVPADISAEILEEAVKTRIEAELHAHPEEASEDGAR